MADLQAQVEHERHLRIAAEREVVDLRHRLETLNASRDSLVSRGPFGPLNSGPLNYNPFPATYSYPMPSGHFGHDYDSPYGRDQAGLRHRSEGLYNVGNYQSPGVNRQRNLNQHHPEGSLAPHPHFQETTRLSYPQDLRTEMLGEVTTGQRRDEEDKVDAIVENIRDPIGPIPGQQSSSYRQVTEHLEPRASGTDVEMQQVEGMVEPSVPIAREDVHQNDDAPIDTSTEPVCPSQQTIVRPIESPVPQTTPPAPPASSPAPPASSPAPPASAPAPPVSPQTLEKHDTSLMLDATEQQDDNTHVSDTAQNDGNQSSLQTGLTPRPTTPPQSSSDASGVKSKTASENGQEYSQGDITVTQSRINLLTQPPTPFADIDAMSSEQSSGLHTPDTKQHIDELNHNRPSEEDIVRMFQNDEFTNRQFL